MTHTHTHTHKYNEIIYELKAKTGAFLVPLASAATLRSNNMKQAACVTSLARTYRQHSQSACSVVS